MKKISLATIGLAMFATPLAAQNPKASSHADSYRSGPSAFSSSSHALAVQQRPVLAPSVLTPSGTASSFGLAPLRTRAGFGYSTSGPWGIQEQNLRDRYGRISR